jgi:hypothetical protein
MKAMPLVTRPDTVKTIEMDQNMMGYFEDYNEYLCSLKASIKVSRVEFTSRGICPLSGFCEHCDES